MKSSVMFCDIDGGSEMERFLCLSSKQNGSLFNICLHIGKILQYILLLYAQYIACVSEYNMNPYMKY